MLLTICLALFPKKTMGLNFENKKTHLDYETIN